MFIEQDHELRKLCKQHVELGIRDGYELYMAET